MNFNKAIEKACKESTLIDALVSICIWESERIIKQAEKNEGWDSCFKICLNTVVKKWRDKNKKFNDGVKQEQKRIIKIIESADGIHTTRWIINQIKK